MFRAYLFRFHYSCITIFPSRVFTEIYTTSKHNIINTKEEGRYRIFFCLLFYLIIFPNIDIISNFYSSIMISYNFCKNTKQHQQEKQQIKGMIDMIFMLHCMKFVLYFMLFILWLIFCFSILLLFSAVTSQNKFIYLLLLDDSIQISKLSRKISHLGRHTIFAISLR